MVAWSPTTPKSWSRPEPMFWSREARFSALPTMPGTSKRFADSRLFVRINCHRTFIPLSHNAAIVWAAAWAAYAALYLMWRGSHVQEDPCRRCRLDGGGHRRAG